MSRKHFQAVAEIISDPTLHLPDSKRLALARRFEELFARENPRFDRGRFLFACGFCGHGAPLADDCGACDTANRESDATRV